MILKFGKGKIGVTTVVYDGLENIIIIEPEKGTGVIGECPKGREKGTEIDLDEIHEKGDIVMVFSNVESVDVVIDKLELVKKALSTSIEEAKSLQFNEFTDSDFINDN